MTSLCTSLYDKLVYDKLVQACMTSVCTSLYDKLATNLTSLLLNKHARTRIPAYSVTSLSNLSLKPVTTEQRDTDIKCTLNVCVCVCKTATLSQSACFHGYYNSRIIILSNIIN